MRTLLLLSLAASLLVGCSRERAIGHDPEALTNECLDDGEFDFVLIASGMAAWEGRLARGVAYEPQLGFATPDDPQAALPASRKPADVRGLVRDGRFLATCPRALRDNNVYPSAAVIVDANRDGRCGPGDFGVKTQRYGWGSSEPFVLPGPTADSDAWEPVEVLGGRIDSDADDFCGAFFPND